MPEAAIAEILKKSRRNNQNKEITGLLICHEGIFTQYLEGPELAIDTLYEKIVNDNRHDSLQLLFDGLTENRYYPQWNMSYHTKDKEQLSETSGFVDFDKEKFFNIGDETSENFGIQLLKNFVDGLHYELDKYD